MKTIYAYGDSFISDGPTYHTNGKATHLDGWAQLLAKKLQCELKNRGVSGGSTENAMLNFTADIESGNFESGDLILFQASTPGRLHLQFQIERPETASVYLHPVDTSLAKHAWYKENESNLKWYIKNLDNRINILNHTCYLHTIINFARSRPDITIVMLTNSDQYAAIPLPSAPSNCLIVPVALNVVNNNEWIDCDYHDWVKFIKFDARVNHMSIPNLQIMANLVEESLLTGNTDNFSYDRFNQKIFNPIRSQEEYADYAAQGLIYFRPDFFNQK